MAARSQDRANPPDFSTIDSSSPVSAGRLAALVATAIIMATVSWGANQILRSYDEHIQKLQSELVLSNQHIVDLRRRLTDHAATPYHPKIRDEIAAIREQHAVFRSRVSDISERIATHIESDPRPDPYTSEMAEKDFTAAYGHLREIEARMREYVDMRLISCF